MTKLEHIADDLHKLRAIYDSLKPQQKAPEVFTGYSQPAYTNTTMPGWSVTYTTSTAPAIYSINPNLYKA